MHTCEKPIHLPVQGILDVETGSKDGFANWRRERDARLAEIRREWSLPIGRRVRIRLVNLDEEFEGVLTLASEPPRIDREEPLDLRLGDGLRFTASEIGAWIVVG